MIFKNYHRISRGKPIRSGKEEKINGKSKVMIDFHNAANFSICGTYMCATQINEFDASISIAKVLETDGFEYGY